MPPNTAVPTARWVAAPAPEAITSGTRPRMKANDVIMTARKRRSAAVVAAVDDVLAAARARSIANSMIRMAFLAASAISTTMPIWAKMLLSRPLRNSAGTAPNRPTVDRQQRGDRDRRALVEADQEEVGEHHARARG